VREQTKANILMSLESTTSRMNALARGELFIGRALSTDEVIERYDAVTREDVLAAARRILRPESLSLSVVGRLRPEEEYMTLLSGAHSLTE
jgi:predicted Zn-dependent peptidase